MLASRHRYAFSDIPLPWVSQQNEYSSREGNKGHDQALAGSSIGIACMNLFDNDHPGVVYPPNITPDRETD